jgi:DNA-directed RNA polymerase subunit H (RpoH/RPB5)
LLLQEGQSEDVLWNMVLRDDLLPELQPQLATRKEAVLCQGLAKRKDLLPKLQWVLATSEEYHILEDLRERKDLLPGVKERIAVQWDTIGLAGGDGYEWMDL